MLFVGRLNWWMLFTISLILGFVGGEVVPMSLDYRLVKTSRSCEWVSVEGRVLLRWLESRSWFRCFYSVCKLGVKRYEGLNRGLKKYEARRSREFSEEYILLSRRFIKQINTPKDIPALDTTAATNSLTNPNGGVKSGLCRHLDFERKNGG